MKSTILPPKPSSLVELLGGSRNTLDHKARAMPFKKDKEDISMEALEELCLEMFVKSSGSADTAAATPATSATSSPSLPPSTPPQNDVRFKFEHLNTNIDDDYDDCVRPAVTTSTTITVSTQTSIITNNDESSINSLWRVPASQKSLRTRNPIRAIVDPIMAAAAAATMTEAPSASSNNNGSSAKDQISLAVSD